MTLTNTRTRIVGDRTGFLADVIIALVRASRIVAAYFRLWMRRLVAVVTPLGWSLLALSPVALFVGYWLGLVEFVAIGYADCGLIVIAAIYLVGRTSTVIELSVPQSRVVVGQRASGRIILSNPGKIRAAGVTVEIPVGSSVAELALPSLIAGESSSQEFVVPSLRRGVFAIGPVRTIRADPIGIVRRELILTDTTTVFIHPRTISVSSVSTGLIRDLEGNPTKDLSTSDVSFHALREYMPGDERRNIHWKSTAKTGTYMVRQFEETRRSHIVIALSVASVSYATDDEFELAVSVAGSFGAQAIRDGRNVSVVVSEKTPEFAKRTVVAVRQLNTLTRSRLLDDLALVEHSVSVLGLTDVSRIVSDEVVGISVAFLVCGSRSSAAQVRSAANKFTLGVHVVAVVCDPRSVPGLRRVGELSILTIGTLEDLQKSLERVSLG